MKKLYSLSFAAVAALMLFSSCSKDEVKNPVQDQEEVVPVAEKVTISVSMPDEGLTKVTLTQDGENKKVIKLAWEYTDELDINGNTFTVKTGSISGDGKSAEFEGTAPTPDGGKYNISYSKLAGGYAEQTQSADGDASHLGYAVSISGADSYTGITFSEAGAIAVGGTFSQSSVLRLRAKLPDAVASAVQKVIFKASENVFDGANTITVNLTTPGTAGDDKTLDVYATLPAGDAITAAAMDLLIQFQTSANEYDKYTAYRVIPASTNFGTPQYIGIDCSNIDKYAGKDDDGTEDHPYLIGDQHQMQAISLSTTKQYYKLVDDIDMTGVTWTSLNAEGTNIIDLDGNSKTLSNMRSPLFADLNGNVHDLTLYNSVVSSAETVGILANTCNTAASTVNGVTVTGDAPAGAPLVYSSTLTSTATEASKYVGGLVGEVSTESKFDDCHIVNTAVTGIVDNDYTYTGGVIGYIHKERNTNVVLNCTVETSTISSYSYTGGLIGYYERGVVESNKVGYDKAGNAKKCTVSGHDNVGGLIGQHRKGYVNNNTTLCEVNGCNSVGGLTGLFTTGEVSGNLSAGEVVASGQYIGGLVGSTGGTIKKSGSSCSISSTFTGTYCFAGGLAGRATGGSFEKCYATGKVNSTSNRATMGGLIAEIAGDVTVKYSYATGNVAVGDGKYTLRGGLVGNIASGTVNISNCYATGKVEAYRWSSGLLGSVKSDALTISNCYTSSSLDFSGPTAAGVFIGNANQKTITYSGIIAWNASDLANFIYNNTVIAAPSGNYFGTDGTINSQATTLDWASIVDDSSNLVWDLTWPDNRPHLAWEEKP